MVQPVEIPMIEITDEDLDRMSNEEIIAWAWQYLGAVFDAKWSRGKIMTELRRWASEIFTLG